MYACTQFEYTVHANNLAYERFRFGYTRTREDFLTTKEFQDSWPEFCLISASRFRSIGCVSGDFRIANLHFEQLFHVNSKRSRGYFSAYLLLAELPQRADFDAPLWVFYH